MAKSQTVLQRKDTTSNSALYISFDLGDKNWQLSLGDDRFHVSRHTVAAGDTAAVASLILKAAARFKISGRSEVYSVYEAGRDGWWFHRWLCELGVGNIVVDPASIEVNRQARQAKTDRLDADKLLAMLIRHHAGERVWSVLRQPSPVRMKTRAASIGNVAAADARAHRAHEPPRLFARCYTTCVQA